MLLLRLVQVLHPSFQMSSKSEILETWSSYCGLKPTVHQLLATATVKVLCMAHTVLTVG